MFTRSRVPRSSPMYLSAGLLLIASRLYGVSAQALTACPTQPAYFLADSGAQFQICNNTDIQAPSSNIINTIASANACLQLCLGTNGCTKAVYDHINSVCHIKGNPTNADWVANTQYDGILFVKNITDGTAITGCQSQQTNITNADGSTSVICPRSDYQVPSTDIINAVADVATCASRCQQTSGCTKAVYDRQNSVCHLKGSPTNPTWVVNLRQFDSVQLVRAQGTSSSTMVTTTTSAKSSSSTAKTSTKSSTTTKSMTTSTRSSTASATASGLVACPANATTFTTDDGSLYETCPSTEYQGSTTKTVNNVLSSWSCLQVCNNIPSCTRVVYDGNAFVCYVKDNTAVWKTSTKYDSVRFVSKSARNGSASKGGLGAWGPVVVMPVIPVAAYVVPQQPTTNRVLMFSSWGPDDFSGATGMTQFADFNFVTGAVSGRTITNTQHDMFCPGISSLQDGRIIITGGENAEATSFYDPTSDKFSKGPNMNIPRGYQSSATTSSGKVFTVGGSFSGGLGGKNGELFDPITNTWTALSGADVTPILTNDVEGAFRTDNHAWLYGWRNGSVFQAGPSKTQHWYDTTGKGSVTFAGTRDPNNDAMCAINVMYDALAGKIFSTGGSQDYSNSAAFTRSYITTIGAPFQPSSVEQVANMINPRGFGNGVVLPDGTILITGGQKTSLVFTDIDSILAPELFNPVTKTFKQLAPAAIPRNYHSVSLLLPDGTVFTGGGGMCPTAYNQTDAHCNRLSDHPSAEVFTPPYLFNANDTPATRPIINSLKSSTSTTGLNAKIGGSLTITMNDASGATFALVRMGSATHSINSDQRRVPLTSVVATQAQYQVQLPNDSGVLIPGYYYLFALSRAGVPSLAKTIQINV